MAFQEEEARPGVDVEVCIDGTAPEEAELAAAAAFAGGASRVELCSSMHLDGLSPGRESIERARRAFRHRSGLLVMVRPRGGDFCYDGEERLVLHREVVSAGSLGADGVVLGLLRGQDGCIDAAGTLELVRRAHDLGLTVTFHRAFDAAPDPDAALSTLLDLGLDRVLTCGVPWGQRGTALDGVDRLARTLRTACGRMEVVLGGGLHPGNIGAIMSRLPIREMLHAGGRVSVHAFSGAQTGGRTTEGSVRALVEAVRSALPR